MHTIKKYANRKLYDIKDKKYLTMDNLAELIKAGEEVEIIDNQTGEDLTSSIVSKLLSRDKKEKDKEIPPKILMQLLRKGTGTLAGYGKKYTTIWQNALTMSKEEVEKLINILVKDKEISETEGSSLKKDITGYTANFKNWIGESIDQRINEAFNLMNLATREQVNALTKRIEELSKKVEELEKKV